MNDLKSQTKRPLRIPDNFSFMFSFTLVETLVRITFLGALWIQSYNLFYKDSVMPLQDGRTNSYRKDRRGSSLGESMMNREDSEHSSICLTRQPGDGDLSYFLSFNSLRAVWRGTGFSTFQMRKLRFVEGKSTYLRSFDWHHLNTGLYFFYHMIEGLWVTRGLWF